MIATPRVGERIKSRFNDREFLIIHVGERMIVLETKTGMIRFVTTIDNLQSYYDYAFTGNEISREHGNGERYAGKTA